MSKYVDGFVLPIAKENVGKYEEIAKKAGEIWKEHGALDFYECVGDDLEIKDMLSFRTTAGASKDETVTFSWIIFESREHRDKVNAAVIIDARMKEMMTLPEIKVFDYKRMAYGGFQVIANP